MIFRKRFCILLAFFVLVSNSGLAFNIHFCEGNIASISSVFSQKENCDIPLEIEVSCCKKKEPTHQSCCSDKEVNLKDKAEKVLLKFTSFEYEALLPTEITLELNGFNNTPTYTSLVLSYYCDAHAPPLYQLYCQYTFYA